MEEFSPSQKKKKKVESQVSVFKLERDEMYHTVFKLTHFRGYLLMVY